MKIALFCLIVVNAYALEPFQEQIPLQMTVPNLTQEKVKWIPLTSNPQEAAKKNTVIPTKSIDEAIKTQIQKKMNKLLKPLNDDEDER